MKNVNNNISFPHFGPETKKGPEEWYLTELEIGYERVVSRVYLDTRDNEGTEIVDEITYIYDIFRPIRNQYSLNPTLSVVVKDSVIEDLLWKIRDIRYEGRVTGIRLHPMFTFNHEEREVLGGGVEWSSYLDPIFINLRKKIPLMDIGVLLRYELLKYLESRGKRNYQKWEDETIGWSFEQESLCKTLVTRLPPNIKGGFHNDSFDNLPQFLPRHQWITNQSIHGSMDWWEFRLQNNPPTKF